MHFKSGFSAKIVLYEFWDALIKTYLVNKWFPITFKVVKTCLLHKPFSMTSQIFKTPQPGKPSFLINGKWVTKIQEYQMLKLFSRYVIMLL